jgi:phosphoserine aminotransferase
MTKRVVNFSAGPAALPLEALERAQREFLDFEGTGMSIMEMSHRGADYQRVHDEAISLLTELLQIPSDYQVLFLQGGATAMFGLVPMNLLPAGKSADFVLTGTWARKAYAEAQIVGKARIAANVEGENGVCTRVPTQAELKLDPEAAYLHFCSNNTIMGTQFHTFPEPTGSVPLFCDMSSDILWKPIDVSKFDLIYAGAQKNIGPSGVTIVIAKKSLIASGREDIPKIFRFKEHAKENSLLNTAPTFAIYMVRNVLAVVKAQGGLDAMEKRNREKARILYEMLDENPDFFRSGVEKASRSVMNPVFRLPTEALDKQMVAEALAAGFVGIKGHKIVGGLRISQYNATTVEHVAQFVEWARGFAKRNG